MPNTKVHVSNASEIELANQATENREQDQNNHISADDQVTLYLKKKRDALSFPHMIAEAILTLKPDFGGIETSDLESVASVGVPLVLIYYAMFVTLLIYFTVIGVQNSTAVAFLSLQGSNADQSCVEKPQSVTGTYRGDFAGRWETDTLFQDNRSLFSISFTGSVLDSTGYQTMVHKFGRSMAKLGQKGLTRSVFYNALAWSTFSYYDTIANVQFTSTVDASTLAFGQFMNGAAWSNRQGICNATTSTKSISMSYSPSIKSYVMSIPMRMSSLYDIDFKTHETYVIPEPCPRYGKTTLFTDEIATDGLYYQPNAFNLAFDVHTLYSIIALNLGMISSTARRYTQTNSVYNSYVVAGFPGTFYVDQLYVPMQAFFCIDKAAAIYKLNAAQIAGPNICFYVYEGLGPRNSVLLYPVGYSLHDENDYNGKPSNQNWVRCKCPLDMYARGCNRQDFHYMLFHRNNMSGPSYTKDNAWKMIQFGISAQAFLVADPVDGDKTQADYYSRVVALTAMINSKRQDPNKVFHSHVANKNSQYTYGGGTTYYGDYVNDTYTHGKTWNQVTYLNSPLLVTHLFSLITPAITHDILHFTSPQLISTLTFPHVTVQNGQLLQVEWDKICPDHACAGVYFNVFTSSKSNLSHASVLKR